MTEENKITAKTQNYNHIDSRRNGTILVSIFGRNCLVIVPTLSTFALDIAKILTESACVLFSLDNLISAWIIISKSSDTHVHQPTPRAINPMVIAALTPAIKATA